MVPLLRALLSVFAASLLSSTINITMPAYAENIQTSESTQTEQPHKIKSLSEAINEMANEAQMTETETENIEKQGSTEAETENTGIDNRDAQETENIAKNEDTQPRGKSLKTFLIESAVLFIAMLLIVKIFLAAYLKK